MCECMRVVAVGDGGNMGVCGFVGLWLCGYVDVQVLCVGGCMDGCVAVWLCRCVGIWVMSICGCVTVWMGRGVSMWTRALYKALMESSRVFPFSKKNNPFPDIN